MKRINITIDEDTSNLLDGKLNKSETIRQAIRMYIGDVSTDTIDGFRLAFKQTQENMNELKGEVKDLNSKIDYIARKLDDSIQ